MGLSFLYGIFHAAGPGHGKAVISSYLFANDETWRRGITLSFASAVMQSLTAISIVGVGAVLLGATAKLMGDTVKVIEIVSYGLIVLLGARLLWVKGYGFFGALSELRTDLCRPRRRSSKRAVMRIAVTPMMIRAAIIADIITTMGTHRFRLRQGPRGSRPRPSSLRRGVEPGFAPLARPGMTALTAA